VSDGPHDQIPIVGTYGGVGLHDQQSPERLRVVKREIDRIHKLANPERLTAYVKDVGNPPEGRLLALAKCESLVAIARDSRKPAPPIDLEHLQACAIGLDSIRWRSSTHYCAIFDLPQRPDCPAVPRETQLGHVN
jgi:hypothetical protein